MRSNGAIATIPCGFVLFGLFTLHNHGSHVCAACSNALTSRKIKCLSRELFTCHSKMWHTYTDRMRRQCLTVYHAANGMRMDEAACHMQMHGQGAHCGLASFRRASWTSCCAARAGMPPGGSLRMQPGRICSYMLHETLQPHLKAVAL